MILVSAGAHALSSAIIDTEALAMGGAGVASATENQGFINPALVGSMTRVDSEFYMIPTAHFQLSDDQDFVGRLDDFKGNPSQSALQRLTKGEAYYDYAAGFGVVLYGGHAVSTLYLASYSQTHSRLKLVESDLSGPEPTEYLSTVETSGLTVVEAGVGYSSSTSVHFAELGLIEWGVTGKVLTGSAHHFEESVADANVDGFYANDDLNQSVSLDLGVLKEWGRDWAVGIAAKNLIPVKFSLSNGDSYRYGPQIRIGGVSIGHRHRFALDLDLLASDPLGGYAATQMLSFGTDYNVGGYLKLRAGIRHDLQGTLPDTYSVGASVNSQYFQISFALLSNDGTVNGLGVQTTLGF